MSVGNAPAAAYGRVEAASAWSACGKRFMLRSRKP